jgi:hypothetical protein
MKGLGSEVLYFWDGTTNSYISKICCSLYFIRRKLCTTVGTLPIYKTFEYELLPYFFIWATK